MHDNPRKKHEAFGLRLKIAVLSQHRSSTPFLERLEAEGVVTKGAFYYHFSGDKRPSKVDIIAAYERLLGTPRGWIADGDGETLKDLREAYQALDDRDMENPVLRRILNKLVNHGAQQTGTESGKLLEIRHIRILSDDQITALISGTAVVKDLAGPQRTIPVSAAVSSDAFIFVIPEHDHSMTATAFPSMPPGTQLLIDRAAPIRPGDFLLIRPVNKPAWMVRRFRAQGPYGETAQFTLAALNPHFEPIRVTDPDAWQVAGRVISVTMAV
jgi:hypothetical protein